MSIAVSSIPGEMMEQLRYIEVQTVKAARDQRVGDYRSPLRGRGFEFDQHKRYQQGDDYRQIDWNVTARMGYPYVKRDFEEKEMSAIILADLSRSMEFSTVEQTKKALLLQIVATLAFSVTRDNMKVGLLGFTDRIELELPPKQGRGQIWKILESLWNVEPRSRKTNFLPVFEHLDTRLKGSTLLFCISDFIAPESIFNSQSLKHLTQRHDFVPLILEDGWEQSLPKGKGFIRLQDTEDGSEMLLDLSDETRAIYDKLMQEKKITLQRALYRLNLDHLRLRAGEPYVDSILNYFMERKRKR